jgi:ABC-type nitrate/sulfonate/bicarbonate transport system substrate-binding protein
MRRGLMLLVTLGAMSAVACTGWAVTVRLALDWTPNTNHTGIFVAEELGYFAEEGLEVDVLEPGPTMSIQLVASGRAEFAVSMQEYVTMFRANEGAPVVSVAAIFQHNTSGFAAPAGSGIETAADFEGKRYGGWGTDLELVTVRTVMGNVDASFADVVFVNKGMIDFATAVRRGIADFFWVFYGWDGIHAELEGIDFAFIPLVRLDEVLDYYTPLIATSEEFIDTAPETVGRFVRALRRGYVYAGQHPILAAEILLQRVRELDRNLVIASQCWLSGRSDVALAEWGRQDLIVWQRFADWALSNGLIVRSLDTEAAFTNAFLEEGQTE